MLAAALWALVAGMEVHRSRGPSIRTSYHSYGIRDPEMSMLEQEETAVSLFKRQPTMSYNGVGVDPDLNWCRHLATHLTNAAGKHKVRLDGTTCDQVADEATCKNSYSEPNGAGLFKVCKYKDAACYSDKQHNCTWTSLMEDLIKNQDNSDHECFSDLLESKRSMDGLEHAGEELREKLLTQNRVIQINNGTIRTQLQQQQALWDTYMDDQVTCQSKFEKDLKDGVKQYIGELEELRAIAYPEIRSAVNFEKNTGYQEKVREGYKPGEAAPNTSVDDLQAVDEKRRADDAAADKSVPASLMEMDAEACAKVSSLLETMQEGLGVKATPLACEEQRTNLQTAFSAAYKDLQLEIARVNQSVHSQRAICMSKATFDYKYAVEGPDMVDDQIEDAAKNIYDAQQEISKLEPLLHDVEHAMIRMAKYISQLDETCKLSSDLSPHLVKIQQLIKDLSACPGRNDFTISVPHWQNFAASTPAPTPWSNGEQYWGDNREWFAKHEQQA